MALTLPRTFPDSAPESINLCLRPWLCAKPSPVACTSTLLRRREGTLVINYNPGNMPSDISTLQEVCGLCKRVVKVTQSTLQHM